jgi:hypothetical protein
MKKDIFIDNNIASKFSNPQDEEYKTLTRWLLKFDQEDSENKDNYAHLVVSNKLIGEYIRSNQDANSNTNIMAIINKLTKEDRLLRVSNDEIRQFKKSHYTKARIKKLRCNNEDREHIPVVLLSDRKYALSIDDNFLHDLLNFPGFAVRAAKRPEQLPYSK